MPCLLSYLYKDEKERKGLRHSKSENSKNNNK